VIDWLITFLGGHTVKELSFRNNTLHILRAILARIVALAIIFACCLVVTGCAALVVGAAAGTGVAYARGDLEADVDATPEEIARATESAFNSMDITTISAKSTALDAEIIGRTAKDTRITVVADAKEAEGSALSIRFGTFGDEDQSRRIYNAILENL
jgi:hypothetical protein